MDRREEPAQAAQVTLARVYFGPDLIINPKCSEMKNIKNLKQSYLFRPTLLEQPAPVVIGGVCMREENQVPDSKVSSRHGVTSRQHYWITRNCLVSFSRNNGKQLATTK